MKNNETLHRQKLERNFAQVNASWTYEDAQLDDQAKELIFKRLNGEITEEEFKQVVMNCIKR